MLDKETSGDPAWTLYGSFMFPSTGYNVSEPEVQILESFPELVEVRFTVTPPTGAALAILTDVPIFLEIPASDDALFEIRIITTCD